MSIDCYFGAKDGAFEGANKSRLDVLAKHDEDADEKDKGMECRMIDRTSHLDEL